LKPQPQQCGDPNFELPEFPAPLITAIFLAVTLALVGIIYKRKRSQNMMEWKRAG
jgi:hypothetical protein